jgi:FMN-dependent NADH-azoreductase
MTMKTNILHIDSSILGEGSVTRALGAHLAETLAVPGATVTHRDLAEAPIGHLSGALFAARASDPSAWSAAQQADVTASDAAMDEFLAADVIVVGAPMYNFGIPSQLKAWIDRVAVAGKTFRYTEKGPEGLAGGKKVIVVSSRGGIYSQGPMADFDFQEAYLTRVFGFLGVTDVEFVRAEGVNFSPDHKTAAVSAAHAQIDARRLPQAA